MAFRGSQANPHRPRSHPLPRTNLGLATPIRPARPVAQDKANRPGIGRSTLEKTNPTASIQPRIASPSRRCHDRASNPPGHCPGRSQPEPSQPTDHEPRPGLVVRLDIFIPARPRETQDFERTWKKGPRNSLLPRPAPAPERRLESRRPSRPEGPVFVAEGTLAGRGFAEPGQIAGRERLVHPIEPGRVAWRWVAGPQLRVAREPTRQARPLPIFGPEGVPLDVAKDRREVIVVLDGKRLEASLPDVPRGLVMPVVSPGMRRQQPPHPSPEVAIARGRTTRWKWFGIRQ